MAGEMLGRTVEEHEDWPADLAVSNVAPPWRWPFADVKEARVAAAYVIYEDVETVRQHKEAVPPTRLILVVADPGGNVAEVVATRVRLREWS